jgi:Holliday junction resolvase RusA-like endonuclease
MMQSFIFDPPPSLNRLYRASKMGVYMTPIAKEWKTAAGWEAKAQGAVCLEGLVSVTVFLHGVRQDTDNTLKLLLDSLNGIAFTDDQMIVDLHVYKRPLLSGRNRVEVFVSDEIKEILEETG